MWRRKAGRGRCAIRAFDQSRHVADHEAMDPNIRNADLRMQRREGIRAISTRVRNRGERRDLRGVGYPTRPSAMMLWLKFTFAAGFARLGEARRLTSRGGKVSIAQSAASAFAPTRSAVVFGQVATTRVRPRHLPRALRRPPWPSSFIAGQWRAGSTAGCCRDARTRGFLLGPPTAAASSVCPPPAVPR